MPRLRDGLRAAVALAVLACAQPAFAQTARVKEPAPRPPLDIKPALKSVKPAKVARAKAKTPKPAETPAPIDTPNSAEMPKPAETQAGPALASASSMPVILPPAPNPAAVPMMPELKPSLAPRRNLTRAEYDEMISKHAKANDVPDALVHRVVMRESRYQPWLVGSCRCYGLMQIKHGTARAMGYPGTASGLLDPDTNLTYAVKYLAGAYRKAKGNADRAIAYYARGY
jgi:soluble lytic murein transglycosylase-like protein